MIQSNLELEIRFLVKWYFISKSLFLNVYTRSCWKTPLWNFPGKMKLHLKSRLIHPFPKRVGLGYVPQNLLTLAVLSGLVSCVKDKVLFCFLVNVFNLIQLYKMLKLKIFIDWLFCYTKAKLNYDHCVAGLLIVIHPDTWQPAIGHHYFFRYLGLALAFSIHGAFCNQLKLYILAMVLILTAISYSILEWKLSQRPKDNLDALWHTLARVTATS